MTFTEKKFKTQSLQPAEKRTKNSQQVLDLPLSYNCSLRDSIFFSDAKRLECTKLKDTKLFSNVNIFNAITISFFTSKWKHKKDDLICMQTEVLTTQLKLRASVHDFSGSCLRNHERKLSALNRSCQEPGNTEDFL